MFSPHEYTWISPGKGLAQIAAFIATTVGLCWVIGRLYPDKPSFPREFEGGLERELGGSGAVRVGPSPVYLFFLSVFFFFFRFPFLFAITFARTSAANQFRV